MKHYSELQEQMTAEQKKKAKEMYDRITEPYKDMGPTMTICTNPDGKKFTKKIDLNHWGQSLCKFPAVPLHTESI